jgi:hypothetical protein
MIKPKPVRKGMRVVVFVGWDGLPPNLRRAYRDGRYRTAHKPVDKRKGKWAQLARIKVSYHARVEKAVGKRFRVLGVRGGFATLQTRIEPLCVPVRCLQAIA